MYRAIAVTAGVSLLCTYLLWPSQGSTTPRADTVETEVQRTTTGVSITRREYSSSPRLLRRRFSATFNAEENNMMMQDVTTGEVGLTYFDEGNDGTVEKVFTPNGDYDRSKEGSAPFESSVDPAYNSIRALLNVDEVVKREMEKPAPTLEESLK